MTFKTHAVAGALAGGLMGGIWGAIAGAIGASLPDLDQGESFIGKRLFFLSFFVKKLGHRQITHSILGVLFFWILSFVALSSFELAHLTIPAAIGYFSHLVIDALITRGVF